jgi:hypothetical protein
MPMKKSFAPVFALAFALVLSGVALAYPDSTATQTVSFEVTPIHAIAVSENSVFLRIDTASAGSEPDDAIDLNTTTYSFTTNSEGSRIYASLDRAMPYGVTLSVELAVPVGYGVSEGYVPLNDSYQIVVDNLDAGWGSGLAIGYKLHAPAEAGYNGSDYRIVTFTLVGGVQG